MSDLSLGLSGFFAKDHRDCDQLWSAVESAVDAGDDARAAEAWTAFEASMQRHFAMEEEVLFPAFEAATGMRGGPTHVMRLEHEQMRGVLDQMAQAANSGDYQSVADSGDTLLMLIQQHNIKEESVLYSMAEQALGASWDTLSTDLKRYCE